MVTPIDDDEDSIVRSWMWVLKMMMMMVEADAFDDDDEIDIDPRVDFYHFHR
jgi:hypothetical protein